MASDTRLADVADVIMGQSPPGSTYNEIGQGLAFFQGVKDFGYRFPTPRVYCTAPTRIAQPGDILLSVRAPIGRVNIADRECATGRGLAIIRPHDPGDARYLEFVLRWLESSWRAIEGGGSVFGNATKKDLVSLALPWPEHAAERAAISSILGALDDKIELNRRMSETLEGIARALFKSWFVDFDPVRAKAEGEDPGLPAPIAELFPASLEQGAPRRVPSGWRVARLDEEFDIVMGQSPPGESYNEDGNGPRFFQGRADFGHRFPSDRVYCTAPTRFAKSGDTLMSVRAPVGDLNVALEDCAIGRGLAALRHKSGSAAFTYYSMQALQDEFFRYEARGTVFGSITKKDLAGTQHVVPPEHLVAAFDRMVGPIDDRLRVAETSSRVLTDLRDACLPQLMNGNVRVGGVPA
ncbi:MAG: restriction endonuclease subunit S [Acidimicrobiia bacterium]|nr:MAG: restriction endonuclease subunit S [Acidimicrobiia bacterium]